MSHIDKVIHELVQREGGFVNKKSDRGGPTKYGITQKTLALWRKKKVSIQDVIDLPLDEAKQIYRAWYVERPGYLAFNDEALAEQLIDAGVNHGCGTAIMILQRAVGAGVDGGIGPDTIKHVAALSKFSVFARFMGQRLAYYADPCLTHTSQWEYAEGWMNRMITMIKSYIAASELTQVQKGALLDIAGYMRQCSITLSNRANWSKSEALFKSVSARLMKL